MNMNKETDYEPKSIHEKVCKDGVKKSKLLAETEKGRNLFTPLRRDSGEGVGHLKTQ